MDIDVVAKRMGSACLNMACTVKQLADASKKVFDNYRHNEFIMTIKIVDIDLSKNRVRIKYKNGSAKWYSYKRACEIYKCEL